MRPSSRQFSDLRLHLRERGLAIFLTQGQAFGIYDCWLAAFFLGCMRERRPGCEGLPQRSVAAAKLHELVAFQGVAQLGRQVFASKSDTGKLAVAHCVIALGLTCDDLGSA